MNQKLCPLEQAVNIVKAYEGKLRQSQMTYMDSFYSPTTETMTAEDWASLMAEEDHY